MLKKICLVIMTVLLMASLAVSVPAEETVNGKIIKIETDKVTVVVEGKLPAWIKSGEQRDCRRRCAEGSGDKRQ